MEAGYSVLFLTLETLMTRLVKTPVRQTRITFVPLAMDRISFTLEFHHSRNLTAPADTPSFPDTPTRL